VCCARERAIELACPESCTYLQDACLRASQRDAELRMKDLALDRAITGAQRSLPLLFVVQGAILNAYRGIKGGPLRDLKDAEILDAVDNAIKNLETEDSGLIYQHQAPTPRVDALSRGIREALDDISERTPADSRLRRSEVLKLLELVRAWIDAHMRNGEEDNSYLRHISLLMPWPSELAQPLII
jgi:hypothetical protein